MFVTCIIDQCNGFAQCNVDVLGGSPVGLMTWLWYLVFLSGRLGCEGIYKGEDLSAVTVRVCIYTMCSIWRSYGKQVSGSLHLYPHSHWEGGTAECFECRLAASNTHSLSSTSPLNYRYKNYKNLKTSLLDKEYLNLQSSILSCKHKSVSV